ncbi:MAG: hypothetical protein ACW972_07425 [Promethearchaeota archaeon]|jgi:hypothetical protein
MSFSNFYSPTKKKWRKDQFVKSLFVFFFILIFAISFLNIKDSANQVNYSDEFNNTDENFLNHDKNSLEIATDTSMLQNPYTKYFDLVRTFFENNYITSLDPDVSTYFRYGDTNGIITDDTIYSEDNLFIYNSLFKSEFTQTQIFDTYLKLKSTPLWFEDTSEQFQYGFVKSVDNSTGLVKNSDRYLIDNLLPIFLLIDNIGDNIDDLSLEGQKPNELIEEIFDLIKSSEFWDDLNKGFSHHNATTEKYSESNFFSILANLLIHRTYNQLDLDESVKTFSYYLANQTMISMDTNMWDTIDKAYYHFADEDWSTISGGQKNYHLDVNALAIISLLEFWIGSGKGSNSPYLLRAIELYDSISIDGHLWDNANKLYINISRPSWILFDTDHDLKANALMLEACLKLFEFTGNFTYYDRAVEIYESIENGYYDSANNSYNFSLSDNAKNLKSNLNLHRSYQKASEIYSSTFLMSEYNLTDTTPDYLIDQDIMNITSVYSFSKDNYYYNPGSDSYVPFTVLHNITDAEINYIFKYPNNTFLYQFENQITDPNTSDTLLHPIEESLPLGNGYYVYIWANKTYFNMAENLTRFNVISGIINESIEGLPDILFQGQTVNITLLINNARSEDLNLTASLEGEDIVQYASQGLNFSASTQLNVSFDLTAKFGIIPGFSEITFNFKRGNIIYLSVKKILEIGYSFNYEHLIYQSKVVSGQDILVSLDLNNFLPNATQSLNISFSGLLENTIEAFTQEETINQDETKSVSYYLKTLDDIKNDSIRIEMNILQNATVYYSEELNIEVIPEFEIISISFPDQIPQGSSASLIIKIQNNKKVYENFTLSINGKDVQANIDQLSPGENWITKNFIPTINPYEFGTKTYRIILKDSENGEIARFYFEVVLELSPFNLMMFYLVPSVIPIGIILYFLSKEIKHKKLRR